MCGAVYGTVPRAVSLDYIVSAILLRCSVEKTFKVPHILIEMLTTIIHQHFFLRTHCYPY